MRTIRRLTLTMLSLALVAAPAHATNGYFSHGYGSYYKALAGAGVAFPQNALAPSTNPAGMVYVGKRFDVGIGLFSPDRQYSVTGSPSGFPGTFGLAPGTVESGANLFTIPSFGANWMVGERSSFGIALYGNGGMNTDYDFPVFGFAPTGVDLSQMFITPTYAVELADGHAVGVSGILAYQRFESKGLQPFSAFSSDPANLTDNSHASSYGGGVRFGYMGKLHDLVSVGASYQSKIYMSEFENYAGLFAQKGDFDIPHTWTVGTAITPNRNLAFLFDVQWIHYDNILSIANPLLPNLATSQLGMEDGAGFAWQETIAYKLGVQYQSHPGLTWRGGYSYQGQPIPESEMLFNIVAPGVVEQHVTFGLSKSVGQAKEITFAVMRAFRKEVSGPNMLEAPGAQTIGLAMSQWEFDVTFSFGIAR